MGQYNYFSPTFKMHKNMDYFFINRNKEMRKQQNNFFNEIFTGYKTTTIVAP